MSNLLSPQPVSIETPNTDVKDILYLTMELKEANTALSLLEQTCHECGVEEGIGNTLGLIYKAPRSVYENLKDQAEALQRRLERNEKLGPSIPAHTSIS